MSSLRGLFNNITRTTGIHFYWLSEPKGNPRGQTNRVIVYHASGLRNIRWAIVSNDIASVRTTDHTVLKVPEQLFNRLNKKGFAFKDKRFIWAQTH